MNEIRLFLAEVLLFVARVICPKNGRHHIKTAADFLNEDFIASECADVRKRLERENS